MKKKNKNIEYISRKMKPARILDRLDVLRIRNLKLSPCSEEEEKKMMVGVGWTLGRGLEGDELEHFFSFLLFVNLRIT